MNKTKPNTEAAPAAAEANAATAETATQKTKRGTKIAAPKTKKAIVAKDIDPNQYVVVRNGFQGRLVYISKKTGERFVWDGFGSEQEMELRELKNARNSYKKFFENN